MSQHDYVIDNGTGLAVRTDFNSAIAAIVTNNSGASAPSTTYAYQWWADTTNALLKIRNGANSAWITVGDLTAANLALMPKSGGTFTAAIDFSNTDYMKIPVGTTAQRPVSPASGYVRYNSDLKSMEIYEESVWIILGDRNTLATKTANYTLVNSDNIILGDATSGAITLTLPTAVGITGKKFQIKKIDSSTNAVNIATTSSQTIDTATTLSLSLYNHYVVIISDGTNWKILGTNILNYSISSSSGSYSTNSTSFQDVTNLSVSITTKGRPVLIGIMGGSGSSNSSISVNLGSSTSTVSGEVQILRNATVIAKHIVQIVGDASSAGWVIRQAVTPFVIDTPSAGAYTYKVQATATLSSSTIFVLHYKMFAIEL